MSTNNFPAKIRGTGSTGNLLHGMSASSHKLDARFCESNIVASIYISIKKLLGAQTAYVSVNSDAFPAKPLKDREFRGICIWCQDSRLIMRIACSLLNQVKGHYEKWYTFRIACMSTREGSWEEVAIYASLGLWEELGVVCGGCFPLLPARWWTRSWCIGQTWWWKRRKSPSGL